MKAEVLGIPTPKVGAGILLEDGDRVRWSPLRDVPTRQLDDRAGVIMPPGLVEDEFRWPGTVLHESALVGGWPKLIK